MPQGFRRAPGGRKLGRVGRASASAAHWRRAPSIGANAEAQATSAHTQSPRITPSSFFFFLFFCFCFVFSSCGEWDANKFVGVVSADTRGARVDKRKRCSVGPRCERLTPRCPRSYRRNSSSSPPPVCRLRREVRMATAKPEETGVPGAAKSHHLNDRFQYYLRNQDDEGSYGLHNFH